MTDRLSLTRTSHSNNMQSVDSQLQQPINSNLIEIAPFNGYNSKFPSASRSIEIKGNINYLNHNEEQTSSAETRPIENETERGRYVVSSFIQRMNFEVWTIYPNVSQTKTINHYS